MGLPNETDLEPPLDPALRAAGCRQASLIQ